MCGITKNDVDKVLEKMVDNGLISEYVSVSENNKITIMVKPIRTIEKITFTTVLTKQ